MQPYRLEMGTKLANARGKDLYAFWGDTPTAALNRLLDGEREAGGEAVLVNLASTEYFKAVRPAKLAGPVVTPVFEDWKGGRYRIIGFYAKRARADGAPRDPPPRRSRGRAEGLRRSGLCLRAGGVRRREAGVSPPH